MATMGAFWEKASIYLNLPKITMTDVVEILIITFLFYYMLVWIKNTRAWVLLKGIMVILLFVLVAAVFQMNTIIWIAKNTLSVAITAIVIIFQPEIRRALEQAGLPAQVLRTPRALQEQGCGYCVRAPAEPETIRQLLTDERIAFRRLYRRGADGAWQEAEP